jgi:hypothetical protein
LDDVVDLLLFLDRLLILVVVSFEASGHSENPVAALAL